MAFKNINTRFWLKSMGEMKMHADEIYLVMKYMSSQSSDDIKIAIGTD